MLKESGSMSKTVLDLGVGAAVGYFGSRAMDRATGWYFERQSKESRRREEEIAPGGAPVLAGRKLAGLVGREVTDDEAAGIGSIVHRSLGVAYGMTAAALARKGVPPVRAGLVTEAAAFLLVDEGFFGTVFTPPPWAYPVESHARGAIGHLAYGAAAGVSRSARCAKRAGSCSAGCTRRGVRRAVTSRTARSSRLSVR